MSSSFENQFDTNVKQANTAIGVIIGLSVGLPILFAIVCLAICFWLARKVQNSNEQNGDIGHVVQNFNQTITDAVGAFGRSVTREFRVYRAEKNIIINANVGDVEGQTVEMFIQYMRNEKPLRFTSEQIETFTSNFSIKLGSGGFGHVYKGEFPNGVRIAVKILHHTGIDKRVEEQFMAEVGTIGRTYHRNIVRLYGFCFDIRIKALIYEFMGNGSIDKLLFGTNKDEVKWEILHDIAIGTARGLEYLHHHSQKRIIHYDIKPGNILLDSDNCPKIADFGLAKLCNRDSSYITFSGARGTPGYAAPELWLPFPVTYKCDVYSYGMMLFEIVGRRRNVENNLNESYEWFPKIVWDKFETDSLQDLITDSLIEEKDMAKAKTMFMVALWCVQHSPEARPSMSSVVQYLESGVEVPQPPNPFQHLLSSYAHITQGSKSNSTADNTTNSSIRDDTTIMRKYEIGFAKERG